MIHLEQEEKGHGAVACIKVVGVGGAGGNTINCMVESGFKGAEFYAVNTDAQALHVSLAGTKIQIGLKSTKGLGAGANPEIGKRAAEEDLDKVMQALSDADIVFVTGGMGGGTGSGAIPVIVQALKEKGILTIVVITKPFLFEGKRRARITEQALDTIKTTADTLLIIPNQKLLEVTDDKVSMIEAFGMINEVLNQSVRSISDIITRSGHINVDFADVREIMKDKGIAVMGTARCSGQGRAKKAALEAINSPLLENMSIAGARSVLLNITGGTDLGLQEISEAASVIYEQADEDANIILGSVIDSQMGNEVAVTIIATGFPVDRAVKVQQQQEAPVQKVYMQPTPSVVQQTEALVQKLYVQPTASVALAKEDLSAVESVEALAKSEALATATEEKELVLEAAPAYHRPSVQESTPLYQPIQELKKEETVHYQPAPEIKKEEVVEHAPQVLVEKVVVLQESPVIVLAPVAPIQEDLSAVVVAKENLSAVESVEALAKSEAYSLASVTENEKDDLSLSLGHIAPEELSCLIEKREELSCPVKPMTEDEEFEQLLREEAELLARRAALLKVAAGRVQENLVAAVEHQPESMIVASEHKETPVQHVAAPQVIDINDLDVPAFMRKQVKERRAE
jgi:cell division protein FtsZ